MFELRVEPEEKQLLPFYGMPVCLLMKDGSSKVGRLTACRAGRVFLNGSDSNRTEASVSRKKDSRRNQRARSRKKESPAAAKPEVQEGVDDFGIAPFGLEPMDDNASAPETVPLQSVDSVLIL